MAAEKCSAMKKLNDITECCICLETFTDPRMLPCIHTFCLHCLKDLADKSNEEPRDALPCPVCKKEFFIPDAGVQGIQKNFFMAGLIEMRNALNRSKIVALSCDICKANNENPLGKIPEASNRCLVCQENLCESCCKMHKSFKMLRNHAFLKIGDDVGDEEAVKNIQTMNCDIHREKILEYYCSWCKTVVCVSCVFDRHKSHACEDVKTVEEEFRQFIKSSAHVISALAEELLHKKEKLECKEDFIKKMVEREKEILKRSEELKEMIDEHTKALLSSLVELKNRHLKEIQTDEEELDRRIVIMESFSSYYNELSLKGSDSDICRNKDELLRRAAELEEDHMLYILDRRVPFDVNFQATDLDNLLKTTNIVGSVKKNVRDLEDFVIAILTDSKFNRNLIYNSYKINLRGHDDFEMLSRLGDIPTPVKSIPAAAVYNNTVFMTGLGHDFDEIWKYNLASGWTECESLIQGREDHCAEFIGETLYICGGHNGGIVMDSIEAYNATTGKSEMVGQLKFGCKEAASVVYKDCVYLFGGLGKDVPLYCVQVFSPIGNTCTILSTSIPFCVSMRALLWDTYAILVGSRTCFIFDFEGKTWQDRPQFKADVQFFGMVLETERIFIIGGTYMNHFELVGKQASHNVKYIRASCIVNNEAKKWKSYCWLPDGIGLAAFAKLSLKIN